MKVFIASSASENIKEKYLELACLISKFLAENNFDLLFGAANYSMMGSCYKEFSKRKRKVYAYTVPIYKKDFKKLPKAKCVLVPDTLLRFRKLYFRSDLIVILPGGIGTLAELMSSIEEYRSSFGNKKIILVNYNNYYDFILDWISAGIKKGFISSNIKEYFSIVTNLEEFKNIIIDFIEKRKIYENGRNS